MSLLLAGPRRIAAAAFLGLLPAVAAACGGSSPRAATGSSTTTTTTTAASAASGTTISATETEYHIALSKTTATAGQVTIKVKNAGQVTHDLVISGPGVSNRQTPFLSAGQTATLVVTLQAGSYDIFCGIPGHKQAGMDATLTVS